MLHPARCKKITVDQSTVLKNRLFHFLGGHLVYVPIYILPSFSMLVFPIDAESPIFTVCPGDESVDGGVTATVTWTVPTATDNSGTQTLTSTHNPGDSFPIGTTTVTYTSTDAAGNTATCSFAIVVTGKINHVICALCSYACSKILLCKSCKSNILIGLYEILHATTGYICDKQEN